MKLRKINSHTLPSDIEVADKYIWDLTYDNYVEILSKIAKEIGVKFNIKKSFKNDYTGVDDFMKYISNPKVCDDRMYNLASYVFGNLRGVLRDYRVNNRISNFTYQPYLKTVVSTYDKNLLDIVEVIAKIYSIPEVNFTNVSVYLDRRGNGCKITLDMPLAKTSPYVGGSRSKCTSDIKSIAREYDLDVEIYGGFDEYYYSTSGSILDRSLSEGYIFETKWIKLSNSSINKLASDIKSLNDFLKDEDYLDTLASEYSK
jgi:hypothetical protein